jgi:hypothetical protein
MPLNPIRGCEDVRVRIFAVLMVYRHVCGDAVSVGNLAGKVHG